jgi:hypothetical protein
MKAVSRKLSEPSYDDLGPDQGLAPVFPPGAPLSPATWKAQRAKLRSQWNAFLGNPSYPPFDHTVRVVESFKLPYAHATSFRQRTSPETEQLLLLLEPIDPPRLPRPGAVVPYYHPDLMAGVSLENKELLSETPQKHLGRHLVEQGYVVVCMEAFPYNTVPDPVSDATHAWWRVAAKQVLHDSPNWTGMGKLVWDTRLATDLLFNQQDIDAERTVIIGHSLGGKMAFYNGCLDERLKAIIASDFGIGWDFTNWEDPWYLGDKVKEPSVPLAHHQLLALHAPRPFFLIAGHYDGPASWQYLNAVRPIYELHGQGDALGCYDHGTGHQPTEESLRLAYHWLAEQFGLPFESWSP